MGGSGGRLVVKMTTGKGVAQLLLVERRDANGSKTRFVVRSKVTTDLQNHLGKLGELQLHRSPWTIFAVGSLKIRATLFYRTTHIYLDTYPIRDTAIFQKHRYGNTFIYM
jgi:hypothetical protein